MRRSKELPQALPSAEPTFPSSYFVGIVQVQSDSLSLKVGGVDNSGRSISMPPRSNSDPVLSIVIVNYNSWSEVEQLVLRLARSSVVRKGDCEVIVVDNASFGAIPPAITDPPQGVRVLLRSDNGGFAVGVNAGWRLARGRWLLLLNPDVIVTEDLPSRVLQRIQDYETRPSGSPGIVGFGLRDPGGRPQPSVGVEPNLFHSLAGLFLPRRRRKYQSGSRSTAGAAPWVTGAFALVDSNVLRSVGGMDEDFFLYYEEVALCTSARRLGWSVEFDPSIEVVHLNPLQNRRMSLALRVITRHSKLLYFSKHLPAWQFWALAWMIEIEAGLRTLVARLRNHEAEARAGQTIGNIARKMRFGERIPGSVVRDLTLRLRQVEHAGPRPRQRGRTPGSAHPLRAS